MMHKYSYHLLLLAIAAISAFSVNPCHAQTSPDSNNGNTKNIIPVTSEVSTTEDRIKERQLRDSASSNNPETILSQTTSETPLANTQSNLRIPIYSKIFAVPSMQQ
jgi:hypothetical protein